MKSSDLAADANASGYSHRGVDTVGEELPSGAPVAKGANDIQAMPIDQLQRMRRRTNIDGTRDLVEMERGEAVDLGPIVPDGMTVRVNADGTKDLVAVEAEEPVPGVTVPDGAELRANADGTQDIVAPVPSEREAVAPVPKGMRRRENADGTADLVPDNDDQPETQETAPVRHVPKELLKRAAEQLDHVAIVAIGRDDGPVRFSVASNPQQALRNAVMQDWEQRRMHAIRYVPEGVKEYVMEEIRLQQTTGGRHVSGGFFACAGPEAARAIEKAAAAVGVRALDEAAWTEARMARIEGWGL